jgi:hypothetical protein
MRSSEPETALDTGQALGDFQATDLVSGFRYKSGISGKQPLRCERVNDITFKITDGEMSRVPASLGKWAGYNTPRALAWVICVASGKWLARCADKVSGPDAFGKAKANALAMAKGAGGDYCIRNEITHLNGLTARLLDQEAV